MPDDLSIGEAAAALGVSIATVRRWDRAGRIRTTRDKANRRRVATAEIERMRPQRRRTGDAYSARNRFTGVVRSVESDGVMAVVEIEAGPLLVTAAITSHAVQELALKPGMQATTVVKATSVMVDRTSAEDDA